MGEGGGELSRREFFRASTGGGFALGGLLGFGMDLRAAHENVARLKIANAREVPSVCPATFQLAVNPNRITRVLYRKPGGTEWETKSLDWAMNRIAELTKKTRDETFREYWTNPEGKQKRVNHTLAIASLGGATMDNEWNYVQCKLMRALGVVGIENQARI